MYIRFPGKKYQGNIAILKLEKTPTYCIHKPKLAPYVEPETEKKGLPNFSPKQKKWGRG